MRLILICLSLTRAALAAFGVNALRYWVLKLYFVKWFVCVYANLSTCLAGFFFFFSTLVVGDAVAVIYNELRSAKRPGGK